MALLIVSKIKQLWNIWNIRVLIQLSLLLQAFLILFASQRKQTGNKWVILLIWSAYLLADWVASFTVGLISSTQSEHSGRHADNGDLLAFWSPFLLLHLGGPDSITSFSLEDNELWIRHALGLILQAPTPTILMFIVGTIKYAERTCALCFASLERFGGSALPKPDPGSEYEKIARRYSSLKNANLPIKWKTIPEPETKFWGSKFTDNNSGSDNEMDDPQLLQTAHAIFQTYKGLIVGHLFSPRERERSRNFFLGRNPEEAFKLVEFELSFMYEVLHTKVAAVRCRLGYVLRVFCFFSVLGSFLYFYLIEKSGFDEFDITLTYALLIGAMILDALSWIMLLVSDWTLICLKDTVQGNATKNIAKIVLAFLGRKRWSGSVSQCNFISYCLKHRSKWLDQLLVDLDIGVYVNKLALMRLSSINSISNDAKVFIFDQLKMKSSVADDVQTAEQICSHGRAWLRVKTDGFDKVAWSIDEFQYAESLLLWHIASELCYNGNTVNISSETRSQRGLCKLLSDYMFHLLVTQPTMMAVVAGNWQVAFQDTCAEAKRFFRNSKLTESDQYVSCQKLLEVDSIHKAEKVKGGKSKSVLFDACMLAKQLQDFKEPTRWCLMNQVWVELMSYAATNCRPTTHAAQVSNGGELLTFIWLLMTHLGLGKQFYQQVSTDKMKLEVEK
ncbi:hypothetical protein F0562_018998 [Nyssa sinensis]|uniref:DUF4220 domain-containing protein n=1 Tax=Nyssa sinensis TaxID=561372 RepID=A0A5J4ZDM8_9ASTE|nr:hypothetical protein F0562_018998 [Nyssa sinensis]